MSLSSHPHFFHPAAAPNAPLLLLLHGTGGDEHSLVQLGRSLLPTAHLLSPRGNVSEHGATRFFRRHAEGVFDIPDLKARAETLADFILAARAHYRVTAGPLLALGYSNGANIAGGLLLARPGLLSAAALLRPMIPYHPDTPPDLSTTRVLLTFGRTDPITPPDHATTYPQMLRTYGAAVESHTLQAGHNLTNEDLRLAAAFLEVT